jgi:hypothetical protein
VATIIKTECPLARLGLYLRSRGQSSMPSILRVCGGGPMILASVRALVYHWYVIRCGLSLGRGWHRPKIVLGL